MSYADDGTLIRGIWYRLVLLNCVPLRSKDMDADILYWKGRARVPFRFRPDVVVADNFLDPVLRDQ
jgi:hypothetical protein